MHRTTVRKTLLAAETRHASGEGVRGQGGVGSPRHHHHHAHLWSRHRFLQAGGILVGAAASGTALSSTASAAPRGMGIISPIPDGSPVLEAAFGLPIPFFLPFEVDPFADAEPSPLADPLLIDDFNGFFGMIEADGVSDNNSDRVKRRWGCDVRFMSGVFVDRRGRLRFGAFSFF